MITYSLLEEFNTIAHFCTTRKGGVSVGNYASFNISPFSGDDVNMRNENMNLLADAIDTEISKIFFPFQTHGNEVRIIDRDFFVMTNEQQSDFLKGVDALITNERGICIGVTTADCVPLTFYDPTKEVVAVAHAGWRGTCTKIAAETIRLMNKHFGCNAADLRVVIGPSISGTVYNVGNELFGDFDKAGFPCQYIFHFCEDKLYLDLWRANEWLLLNEGVSQDHIEISGVCTYTNHEEFFSARRLGIKSGRMFSGIKLK